MCCRCFIFRVLEGNICSHLRSGGLLLPGVILGSSPTLASSQGFPGGESVAGGRGERAEPCTHTLQQLFLIWNTFSIKDTPSVQLTNGYIGILETAEFYTHDCTGHQWLGSLECSIDFQTLFAFCKRWLWSPCCHDKANSVSAVDRLEWTEINRCPSPLPLSEVPWRSSGGTGVPALLKGGTAGWALLGRDQTCCKNTLYRVRLYRYRDADRTPPGPCDSLQQELTPCHSWAGDTA